MKFFWILVINSTLTAKFKGDKDAHLNIKQIKICNIIDFKFREHCSQTLDLIPLYKYLGSYVKENKVFNLFLETVPIILILLIIYIP